MAKWIVMVDDDLDMHYIYQKVFKNVGLSSVLRLFENGVEALDFLDGHADEVKLIFSDINMPYMDGIQLRATICNDLSSSCRSIPFVFLSTSTLEKEVKTACDLFVQGFFQKGMTLAELEKTIKGVIDVWGNSTLQSHHVEKVLN